MSALSCKQREEVMAIVEKRSRDAAIALALGVTVGALIIATFSYMLNVVG